MAFEGEGAFENKLMEGKFVAKVGFILPYFLTDSFLELRRPRTRMVRNPNNGSEVILGDFECEESPQMNNNQL